MDLPIRKGYSGSKTGIVLDGTTVTAYSAVVPAHIGNTFSLQMDYLALASSLTATVELHATNHKTPSDDDSSWVVQTALSARICPPAALDENKGFEVANAGFLYYRVKFSRTAGSGTIDTYYAVKEQVNR